MNDPIYPQILTYFKDTIKSNNEFRGIPIYNSDIFIDESTQLPAISIQRETINSINITIDRTTVQCDISFKLHIPPKPKDKSYETLYKFEEMMIKIFTNEVKNGKLPDKIIDFNFVSSDITNMFLYKNNEHFAHVSIVKFRINYEV